MTTRVKNLTGTGDKTCGCGSWKNHYTKQGGGTFPVLCQEVKCMNRATVGAHVKKTSSGGHYIIPLCDEHNGTDKEFDVSGTLVSANIAETCGRALSKMAPIYNKRTPY